MKSVCLIFGLMFCLAANVALSAEIVLRATAHPTGAMVTLGDIAEIHADTRKQTQALAALELVPAPSVGRTRTLKLREVQDLLALQDVKPLEHQFSGANVIQITSGDVVKASATAKETTPVVKIARIQQEQIQARVERAILRHLQQAGDDRVAWSISAELTNEQFAALSRTGELVATGGTEPWTGEQQFQLQTRVGQALQHVTVKALVKLPEQVVVVRRPVRRGEVIRASDVELQTPATGVSTASLATALEDVVGRETTRSFATGQPLETSQMRKPIMVRRGEVVTVYARSGKISVRTQARATQDGGEGDIVNIERLDDRQRFNARVIGVQELEVLVGGVQVTNK